MSKLTTLADQIAAPEGMYVQDRLNGLLHLTSASGLKHFDEGLKLVQIDRRIISLVGAVQEATFTDLVKLTGQQRAQVSRSMNGLLEAGILDRTSIRAHVQLSPKGQSLFQQIMDLTAWRDAYISKGIDDELRHFFRNQSVTLVERSAQLVAGSMQSVLVAKQSGVAQAQSTNEELKEDERVEDKGSPTLPRNWFVIPPVTTLSVYLNRAATMFAKQAGSLAYFDAHLLSLIGNHDPITQYRLTQLALAKKSQVVRALSQLEDRRLIEREKVAGRRDILIYPTANGRELWSVLAHEHARRDKHLFETTSRFDEVKYRALIEILIQNARDLAQST